MVAVCVVCVYVCGGGGLWRLCLMCGGGVCCMYVCMYVVVVCVVCVYVCGGGGCKNWWLQKL